MRHDAYGSPGRMIFIALVSIILVALIVAGVMVTGRQNDSSPGQTAVADQKPVTDTTTATTAATTTLTDGQALNDAVYSFVEAYNLPTGDRRNSVLKSLSTPEGYDMVMRDPQNLSPAEKAAENITVKVIRESSSVQAEPFDDDPNAVSVYVTAKIRLIHEGQVLRTVRLPGQTMSWVKQANSWKFAYLQT